MQFNDIMIVAEKLANGSVSSADKEIKQCQQIVAEMMKTEDGRIQLAEIIEIALVDAYNKFDLAPYIFDKKHFEYGDKPVFKTHKKGIKAYWSAPNSYIPKSENYSTEITMTFESLGVRPTALLSDLKTGRIDSLAQLMSDGQEALTNALYEKVYRVLAQTYNSTKNADNFATTNALNGDTLKKAVNHVRKKVGGNPVIIGDFDLCSVIETFDGYADNEHVQDELREQGYLGKFKGCPIFYLPEILDPVTQKSIVPTNKLFVVGRTIGDMADYGTPDTLQEIDINDKSWSSRTDMEVGFVVTKPEGLYVIEVTD